MDAGAQLAAYIKNHQAALGKVVAFDESADRFYHFDFTAANTGLNTEVFSDTEKFSVWVNQKLNANNCKYGIGGYMEHRTIYARSTLFNTTDEPRRLHLGVDIWAGAGTAIYAPFAGQVHSFNDNNNFGDYGPTIILQHNLNGLKLYSLYGHLSRESLRGLAIGQPVNANQQIATFGIASENGNWPPHLHFQLMFDMEGHQGDYPGVCRYSQKHKYLKNVPNPQLILQFPKAVNC